MSLSDSYFKQALIQKRIGNTELALSLFKDHEIICREMDDHIGLADSLGNKAIIFKKNQDFSGALSLLEESEHQYCAIDAKDSLLQAMCMRVKILKDSLYDFKKSSRNCGRSASFGNRKWKYEIYPKM